MKRSEAVPVVSNTPTWFASRISILKRTGKLSFAGEQLFDPAVLSRPHLVGVLRFVKVLDISGAQATSLQGCPHFPRLVIFVGNRSGICNFTNFRVLKTATTISLKETSVSKLPTYRLSLLLALGSDNQLVSLDGCQIREELKVNVKSFPQYCHDLANHGWIATRQPPPNRDLEELCTTYSVELPFIDSDDEDEESSGSFMKKSIATEFEGMIVALREHHKDVWRKGKAQFGLNDDDEALNEEVLVIPRRHHPLERKFEEYKRFPTVEQLCTAMNRSRQA
jgi:hypothetical protein